MFGLETMQSHFMFQTRGVKLIYSHVQDEDCWACLLEGSGRARACAQSSPATAPTQQRAPHSGAGLAHGVWGWQETCTASSPISLTLGLVQTGPPAACVGAAGSTGPAGSSVRLCARCETR